MEETMAETTDRGQLDRDDRLFEEAFLLQAQVGIQRLLNRKRLKYRDLSKRLGVSEARVSQMLSEDASNLTIRTIARIYYHLGEEPLIVTKGEYDAAGTGHDTHAGGDAWTMVATDVHSFEVAQAQLIEAGDAAAEPRAARSSEWIDALPMLTRAG
jgi:transcriptional regulator with XRE-family HTH domain